MAAVSEIQRLALSLLGAPYVLGCEPWYDVGYEPSAEMAASDCSGLVYAVFRRAGVPWRDGGPWPRLTADEYAKATMTIPRARVRCGDVALFAGASGRVFHIALAIDHNRTVEARGRRWGVVAYPIDDPINGVVARGARFGRFPWLTLGENEEDDMTPEQAQMLTRAVQLLEELVILARQGRVSDVARSYGEEILLEQQEALLAALVDGDKAAATKHVTTAAQLEAQRAQAVATEKRRLGLT